METTSGIVDGLLSLPEGGGSLHGLGERFQPDLVRGTGNFSVPINLPKGPNSLAPSLSLRYSTGQGNGHFGLGWQLTGPIQIARRADRRLPTYSTADQFTLGGADTLVPVGGNRYRPRSDTQFWNIQYDQVKWTIRTKEGRTYSLGSSPDSRIFEGTRTFAWLVDSETDPAGNTISYTYERDQRALYLSQISWSIYSLRFIYEPRPDVIHDARAGFPVLTARRCTSIERRCESLPQPLVARYNLQYTQALGAGHSLLEEVRLTGFDEGATGEQFPPLRFGYTAHQPGSARYVRVGAKGTPPPSLDEPGTTLVDMNGDGVPDVLKSDIAGHRYWPNRGDGSFAPMRRLPLAPSGMDIGRSGVSFADLDGDGSADLMRIDARLGIAVLNTGAGGWAERPIVYRQQFPLRLSASETRLIDLDGDGIVDLMEASAWGHTIVYNLGEQGWSAPSSIGRTNADNFPDVDFRSNQIHLTDMTGDGLTDIVFVASGRVEYWPSYGYGTWGNRVRMRNAPVLPQRFDPQRIFFPDIDGDGAADLLYIDFDRVYYWFNQSGQAWSERFEVPFVPPPNMANLQVADLLGNGTAGLVWSSRDRRGDSTGYRYLDLGGGVKPYLLESIDHGMGGTTQIKYTTTTAQRLEDADSGEPWDTYLPFPIHVVSEIARTDALTGRKDRQSMRYHRGYYDGQEREFRGFERVEVTVPGDVSTPTTVQETRFFQGAVASPRISADRPLEAREKERALSGSPLEVLVYEVADGSRVLRKSATLVWDARVEFNGAAGLVYFPHAVSTEAHEIAPGEPHRIERSEYTYDNYGNIMRKRRTSRFDNEAETSALVDDQTIQYAVNESDWLLSYPASIETRDRDGKLVSHTRHYYDGPQFTGLPSGQVTQGLLRRTRQMALADWGLPAGYAAGIDATWGLTHEGEGWYGTSVAYDHDSAGNVVAQENGLGARKSITYDADSLFPLQIEDPDGRVTRASFDKRTAQPLELDLPDGRATRYVYSPAGRLKAIFETASDGTLQLVQAFSTDFGDYTADPPRPARIVSIRPRNSGRTLSEFEGDLDPSTIVGASVACDYYDSDGNLLHRVSRAPDGPGGEVRWVVSQRREYTNAARSAVEYPNEFTTSPAYKQVPPAGDTVRFFYDGIGQVRRVERPDGTRLAARYLVNRIEKLDPLMPDGSPPLVERYNARGDLISVEQPDGTGGTNITRYGRDISGRISSITDPTGRILATYSYAGLGSPIKIVHADAGERTYWRDAQGQLRVRTDSLGRRLLLDYEALGRVLRAVDATDAANPVVLREITYNGSLVTSVRENGLLQQFTYDSAARPTTQTVQFGQGDTLTVQREYGLQAEVRSLTYPDGTRLDFQFDDSASLRGAAGFVTGVEYDPFGSPTRISFEGGASTAYAYDALRRMQTASLEAGGNTIRRIAMVHDANGNITGVHDEVGALVLSRQFTYDSLYRLTSSELWQGEPGSTLLRRDHYQYSPTGDLTSNEESLAGAMVYGDAAHTGRLTEVQTLGAPAAFPLSYDDAGRLTAFGELQDLKYDIWDRLVEATAPDGSNVRFEYDYKGARLRKTVQNATGTHVTRYAENLYETAPEGTRLNVYLGKLMVAVRTTKPLEASATIFVLTDQVGSILAGTDAAGNVRQQQVYSPFGLSLRPAGEHDRFIGLGNDAELGLAQFGARYYAPALGRFITPDWFIIENPNRSFRVPQGLNAYSYAINNPLSLRDQSGMWFGIDDLIAAGIGFVVGFIAGVIHGAANGYSFGDTLLNGLEGGLVGAAGAWLAYNTMGLALGLLGVSAGSGVGLGIAVGAAVVGGLNGAISGAMQIYDWGSWTGWAAFLADSTWGLTGTTLGVLLHGINVFYGSGAQYNQSLSRRQNRHVYDGGFGFGNFAFTQGNVTSNLQGRTGELENHETLHIFQSRLFGPIFQVTYIAWMVVGAIVGFFIGLGASQGVGKTIEDIAYYDNPWETWAYKKEGPNTSSSHGGDFSWA